MNRVVETVNLERIAHMLMVLMNLETPMIIYH